jgi:flavin-dependent dehydrogenase
MTARHDVVVVGGRLAGAATAMLLARAGVRVLVLERSAAGSDTVSTHALLRGGVLQLSRWGLLGRVVDAGTPAVRATTFRNVGVDPLRVTIRPGGGVDALYAPRRTVLDRILADAAIEAGAELRPGVAVAGLDRDSSGRVRGVVDTDGVVHPAAYVVGADGVGSSVARAAGAAATMTSRHASAVRYAYLAGLAPDGYQWMYGAGVAAGLIPTNDGLHNVFVATAPATLRREVGRHGAEGAFGALLRAAAPDLADRILAAPRVGSRHGWGGLRGHLRRPWGAGWALVGDAGYYKDPISTHGQTDALRDAELLSTALLDVLGGAPEAVTLAAYERRRDALSRPLFEVTDEIASYAWNGETVQPLLRRLSAAMTDEVELLASIGAGVA